jgi:hypothetical protein
MANTDMPSTRTAAGRGPNTRIYYSEEAERIAKRQRMVSMIIFSAMGIGIGGLLALLFAPHRELTMREKFTDKVEDGLKSGRDVTGDALKRLEQEYQNLRDQVEKLVSNVKN